MARSKPWQDQNHGKIKTMARSKTWQDQNHGKIKTMAVMKKGISIGSKVLYDTELIVSRVMGLQASSREVNFKDVLSYELAPIPNALVDDSSKTMV